MMYSRYIRCPHCTTLYRMAIAQLTLSQGKVRCANCQQYFNALQQLKQQSPDEAPLLTTVTPMPTHGEHHDLQQFFQQTGTHSHITLLNYLNHIDPHAQQNTASTRPFSPQTRKLAEHTSFLLKRRVQLILFTLFAVLSIVHFFL
ncbi:MAG: zinc-ribbon domain-containing protein [Acinetobacter sp.]|nr:zinc-ribbon domain-containing protein [Acinetobacter sp.]